LWIGNVLSHFIIMLHFVSSIIEISINVWFVKWKVKNWSIVFSFCHIREFVKCKVFICSWNFHHFQLFHVISSLLQPFPSDVLDLYWLPFSNVWHLSVLFVVIFNNESFWRDCIFHYYIHSMLGGKAMGFGFRKSTVKLSVFYETEVAPSDVFAAGMCEIDNGNERTFVVNNACIARFHSIRLKNFKRTYPRGTNEELVTEQKYAFVFYTTVSICGREFPIKVYNHLFISSFVLGIFSSL